MDKVLKPVLATLLAIVSVGLIYLTYRGIAGREEFKNIVEKREVKLKAQLKKVLQIQQAYEERYGNFATIEDLKTFLASDSIFSVKAEGEYTSEMRDEGKTEDELAYQGNKLFKKGQALFLKKLAGESTTSRRSRYRRVSSEEKLADKVYQEILKMREENLISKDNDEEAKAKAEELLMNEVLASKLLIRDTTWKPAISLLEGNTNVEEVFTVPVFGGTKASLITIDTAYIEQIIGLDTVQRSVFSAQIPCESYLSDQDEILLKDKISLLKERLDGKGFPGLKIGSLTEIKATGNWE